MTNEELDKVRARKAYESAPANSSLIQIAEEAARLAREGWVPQDPVLVEARKIVAEVWQKRNHSSFAESTLRGNEDDTASIEAVCIALRRGK